MDWISEEVWEIFCRIKQIYFRNSPETAPQVLMEPDPIFPMKGGCLWRGALAASMGCSAEI